MPRNLFFPALCSPRWSVFEFAGAIDAALVTSFANRHPRIRVDVRATCFMPQGCYGAKILTAEENILASSANRYEVARFNLRSTGATPVSQGMFPGIDFPDAHTREIFNQDVHPISICFRASDCGPDLAVLFFNKKEGRIEGRIQQGDDPLLLQIRDLIERLQLAPRDARSMSCS